MTTKPQRIKRALLGASLLFLSITATTAQGLLQAEFRIDGGAAQPMSVSASNTNGTNYLESSFAASVTAATLSVGPHYLEVRMKGTNNVWCGWQGQWFRVSGPVSLTAAEVFVDADPGPGLGTPIPLPADGAWGGREEDFVIPGVTATNLSTGRHTLFIRCKDSNGDWGMTSSTVFYVGNELSVVAAEWTANPYAAAGTGFPMQITPVTNSPTGEVTLKGTNTTLAAGTNYCATYPLYVRVQDSLGRWSTREGWYLDAARTNWLFDAGVAWQKAKINLVVAPEVASAPVLGNHVLTNNGAFTLRWKSCAGVTGYQVFGRGAFGLPFTLWGSSTTNLLTLAAPFTNSTFNWFVRSLGGNECSQDGYVWQFTVAAPRADDTDNDGIPDAWERLHFGGALFRANGTTDWDGDGAKDWEEWAAGTNPTDALDYFKLPPCRLVLGGVAQDVPTAAGRQYTVHYAFEVAGPDAVWYLFDQFTGTGSVMSTTNLWPDPRGFFHVSASPPLGGENSKGVTH